MESSPLTLAHDHARAASVATSSSDTTVAINQHALAAGEFAKAASGIGSAEAMRTLRLLEHHHRRLSELLRYPSENPPTATSTEPEVQLLAEKPLSTSAAVAELRSSKSDIGNRSSSPARNPPSLQHPRRLPPRDLSSSIASNLASARGIRNTRMPTVSGNQVPGSLETHSRRDGKRTKIPGSIPEHTTAQPSWVPPTHNNTKKAGSQTSTSRATAVAENAGASKNPADENFSRFYSTVGSFLNKLSAPLVFAALPLTSEEVKEPAERELAPVSKKRPSNSTDNLRQEPDLSKYISQAALRATTRDGNSANDSFYVVPTAGHTMSYAQILSFDQKEKRRMRASLHSENPEAFADPFEEDDDFEDARETPMPNSTAFLAKKPAFKRAASSKQLENRVEELNLENQSLKEVVDRLSKRLSAFEMGAQQSSMALQQSIRMMRSSSPARDQLANQDDEALRRKVIELEERVMLGAKEAERLSRDNEKLKAVVSKYRDRWEKLKEGAKTRREGSMAKDGKDTMAKNDVGAGRFLAG
ncbi:hypothetical protein HYALB_00005899 [Hymenoscyphus albidus]|uniref:Uncharacterized protein n=1 Tax=Hymenoscyphus albidus TaxID=595503 RepID=A0A9N9PXB5_9HELO|nr:hypothetical protein HYALB_00005899 [Hymenoscyphus albidus]